MPDSAPTIDRVVGQAFRIPTDAPEADGTLAWNHTTLVIAEDVFLTVYRCRRGD